MIANLYKKDKMSTFSYEKMSLFDIFNTMKRSFKNLLISWKNHRERKPLIIRGARQVGKTYILKEFGKDFFPKSHYFNFEKDGNLAKIFEYDLNPKRILNELNFRLNKSIDVKSDLVIFDEIQACPKALTSLKYFNEDIPELALCSAGSLLGIHLGNASYPVGKVDMLTMFPMSFEEFLLAVGDKRYLELLQQVTIALQADKKNKIDLYIPDSAHEHLWAQLKIYFVTGGLPEVVKTYVDNQENLYHALQASREKQEQLIIAYNADMAKHSGKVNAMHIDRIWKSIPSQLAQSQDGSAKKFKFKGVIPGVSRFDRLANGIDWLEAAGLIIKIPITKSGNLPFSAYIKENTFKLLCFDVGILGAMSGLSPEVILNYDYGSYKGYFAENYVAQEFLYCGKKLFSWEEGASEVEFLLEEAGKVIPVEVKSGWITKAKSLRSFMEKYHPPYQLIFSAKNLHIDMAGHTCFYPLYLSGCFF
jgi:uncharacterized protein